MAYYRPSKSSSHKRIAQDQRHATEEKRNDRQQSSARSPSLWEVYKARAVQTSDMAAQQNVHPSYAFHTVDWSRYMTRAPGYQITINKCEAFKDAFTLSNVLSRCECERLVYLSECHGYARMKCAAGKYRTNTRVIFDDVAFADMLFERIKRFLPKTYRVHGKTWELCGLNPRLRFCKYVAGQRFNMHCDKRVNLPGEKHFRNSFYTVNAYINDQGQQYEGGRTVFYTGNKRDGFEASSHVSGESGMLLVFNHFPQKYQHCGEPLARGTKYIFRSDVMYTLQRRRDRVARSAQRAIQSGQQTDDIVRSAMANASHSRW